MFTSTSVPASATFSRDTESSRLTGAELDRAVVNFMADARKVLVKQYEPGPFAEAAGFALCDVIDEFHCAWFYGAREPVPTPGDMFAVIEAFAREVIGGARIGFVRLARDLWINRIVSAEDPLAFTLDSISEMNAARARMACAGSPQEMGRALGDLAHHRHELARECDLAAFYRLWYVTYVAHVVMPQWEHVAPGDVSRGRKPRKAAKKPAKRPARKARKS